MKRIIKINTPEYTTDDPPKHGIIIIVNENKDETLMVTYGYTAAGEPSGMLYPVYQTTRVNNPHGGLNTGCKFSSLTALLNFHIEKGWDIFHYNNWLEVVESFKVNI